MIFNTRVVQPDENFAKSANLKKNEHGELMLSAQNSYEEHWAKLARQHLVWKKPFSVAMKWEPPFVQWFCDGELNISEQCLDKHLNGPAADKTALIWEGEPGDIRTLTYQQLHSEVSKCANVLKSLGVKKGEVGEISIFHRICKVICLRQNLPERYITNCRGFGACGFQSLIGMQTHGVRIQPSFVSVSLAARS